MSLEAPVGVLHKAGVEFILIGGLAAVAHGAAYITNDVDVLYRRTPENIARLAAALAPHEPYLRGVPPGLPFRWDTDTIRRGLNFTLVTSVGILDLLGEVAGGGFYEDVLPFTTRLNVFGTETLCVDLPTLIRLKRAAGRPKDLAILADLEALLEETERMGEA
jgi:hypothetical protein